MPILDYCNVVWSPCSALYTWHLERVHTKFVSSLPASTFTVFDLKLSLIERWTYHTAVQVLKFFMSLLPLTYMACSVMPQQFLDVLGEILGGCMFQASELIMDKTISGIVVPLFGIICLLMWLLLNLSLNLKLYILILCNCMLCLFCIVILFLLL